MDWKALKNFDKGEWKTDPNKVYPNLINTVDRLASFVKIAYPNTFCMIHVAWEDKNHEENSKHYQGRAVDLHFQGIPLFFQFMLAQQFPFTGIGVYPYWNNPGLHLEIEENYIDSRTKRWWRDRENEYRAITEIAFYEALRIA